MLKDRQQKSNQDESSKTLKSPEKKIWNKPSNQSRKNYEDETEEFKGGLPKFGGTKSLASNTNSKDKSSKASDGPGSLMSQLESFSGMWNDQDVAPVEVDYQRKRKFNDAGEEEPPSDGDRNAFQLETYGQEERIKDNLTDKKEKPIVAVDSAPKQKTLTGGDQKKKELDNQKRIMSLQQRNDALKAQQNLIKSALQLTNDGQNKKKIFFDDEPAETTATTDEPATKKQQKLAKPSEKRPKLFNDDDEEEENIEDYANDFKSRPQFDAEGGHEVTFLITCHLSCLHSKHRFRLASRTAIAFR